MSVLTLLLAGPLQSWGASARFTRRTTEAAPTKSGVLGILAAAQGIQRGDDRRLAELAALRFGVRVDQPGTRISDFQTAHHRVTGKSMPLSTRFYLADAVFTAALEGDRTLLTTLHNALRTPVYPTYLGRRSCPPAQPVELAVHDTSLTRALTDEPWHAAPWYQKLHRTNPTVPLVVLRDTSPGDGHGDTLRDHPLSFAAEHRRHALRTVISETVDVSNPRAATRPPAQRQPVPHHDPFGPLEDNL
ncbi:type I-E CRISPR-associated protein Cas5/CasD (plasmid) [Streptomyces poriferorum]|uniref:type I-E CRISPR-associated protein Cas5/CasD n=1 Tax=Streptomyces poriferorum TaxID=2798799 RepID=UPI00273FF0AF|nr:type I-E CRISPR-associated protein Cas5/CasD [Streptomyces sp. Alt1]WLQ53795.1 type I-E CRISPR-associated protein Cas5/CasD [Streptomyces sp. Alt1]